MNLILLLIPGEFNPFFARRKRGEVESANSSGLFEGAARLARRLVIPSAYPDGLAQAEGRTGSQILALERQRSTAAGESREFNNRANIENRGFINFLRRGLLLHSCRHVVFLACLLDCLFLSRHGESSSEFSSMMI